MKVNTQKKAIETTHSDKKSKKKELTMAKGKEPDFLTEFLKKENQNYLPPIEDHKLKMIYDDLTKNYSEQVLEALLDEEIRQKLVETVLKEHGNFFQKDEKVAEYIVQETIGTGIIEKIMTNPDITDLGWNGSHLSIETNNNKWLIDGKRLNITQDYIDRVISKYATVNEKAFNTSSPILNGMFKNVRIAATHDDNSPIGATMSMRVARPRLVLNKENFTKDFAPDYILDLFEKIVQTKANICISGETGTGKTELQKLLLSFTDNSEKIIMIEDVQETHAKKLFPEKDVYSWLTTPRMTIAGLVKECLRNNPKWIIVSETRGSEAYEMLQAVLSGHFVITTLHAINARAIPRRFVNMCTSGFDINESAVEEDIYRYFDFGVHIKQVKIGKKTVRYLNEIVEFSLDETTTIFNQKYVNGKFIQETGELSDSFKERMSEKSITFEFPAEIEDETIKDGKEEDEKEDE